MPRNVGLAVMLMVLAPPAALAGLVLAMRATGLDTPAPLLLAIVPGLVGVWRLPIRAGFRLALLPVYAVAATAVLFIGTMLIACQYRPCY